jgi:hypothetical protein
MSNDLRLMGVTRACLLGAIMAVSPQARAQVPDSPTEPARQPGAIEKSAATEVTRVAYTHTAFGASALTIGGAGFGEATGAYSGTERPHFGGGVRVWGSPVDRLTILADGERRETSGEFAPSASLQVRILGSRDDGWALGGLGRYKAEGFAELGGEAEFALLGSYARYRVHFDANAVVGTAFEEKESDVEGLVRAGYDVLSFLRVGGEGRLRYRIAGDITLPGGRDWDGIIGPQVLGHDGPIFGAVTGGPSTVGLTQKVGWAAIATLGGVAF